MTYSSGQVAAWNALQAMPRPQGEPHVVMLRNVELIRWAADAVERSTVRDMREKGWTWAEVGEAFGVTHQAAQQRWKKRGID